jgi:hypothetical protein
MNWALEIIRSWIVPDRPLKPTTTNTILDRSTRLLAFPGFATVLRDTRFGATIKAKRSSGNQVALASATVHLRLTASGESQPDPPTSVVSIGLSLSTPRRRSIQSMTGVTAMPCTTMEIKMMTNTVAHTTSALSKDACPDA